MKMPSANATAPCGLQDYVGALAELERIRRAHMPQKLKLRKQIKSGKDLLLKELQANSCSCLSDRAQTIFVHRKVRTAKGRAKLDATSIAMALSSLQPTSGTAKTTREVATEHVIAKLKDGDATTAVKESVEVGEKPPKDGSAAQHLATEMEAVAREVFDAQVRLKQLGVAEGEECTGAKRRRDELEAEALEYLNESTPYACARVAAADRKYTLRTQKRKKVGKLDVKALAPIVSDAVQAVLEQRNLSRASSREGSDELVKAAALRDFEAQVSQMIHTFYEAHTTEEDRIDLVEN